MNFSKNKSWSPNEYAEAAVVAHHASEEILERLNWMTIQPNVILDVGCGSGEGSLRLHERYPLAQIVTLDHCFPMVQHVKDTSLVAKCVCGEGEKLPLLNQSVDLIFANFFLPWQRDVKAILKEWLRVLSPNGLLILSTLGLNTLGEWQQIFSPGDLPALVDMHDVGDALLQAGFSDPVLDVDTCQVTYRDVSRLLHDLKASQLWFPNQEVDVGKLILPSPNEEGVWSLTYEVVYAHAFAPQEKDEYPSSKDGSVNIPLAHLRRQLAGQSR